MLDRRILGLATALVLLLGSAVSWAQPADEPARTETPETPQAFPLAEVTLAAEQTRVQVGEISKRLAPSDRIVAIDQELPERARDVEQADRQTETRLEDPGIGLQRLTDLENEWLARQKALATWHDEITRRGRALSGDTAQLDALSARWKATRIAAQGADADAALEWVDRSIALLREAGEKAGERTRELVSLQSRLASVESSVTSTLEKLRGVRASQRSRLLDPDSPPLWAARPQGSLANAIEIVRSDLDADRQAVVAFAAQESDEIALHLALMVAVFALTVALNRRVASWTEDDPDLGATARVFRHPGSVALLAGVMTARWFYPLAPQAVRDLVTLALLIPALRLLPPLVDRRLRPVIFALAGFYLAAQVREFTAGAPFVTRAIFSVEATLAVALLAWLLRPARLQKVESPAEIPRLAGVAMRLALAIAGLTFLANLFGYFGFAGILGGGLLWTAYAGVVLYGAYRVVRIFVAVGLRTTLARRLRMVRVGTPRIERWVGRFLRVAAFVWWIEISLRVFDVKEPALALLRAIVTASASFGEIDISLGDVLLFAATITAAFFIARFVRFVLQEDVFPRVVMRRGVSNAISTTVDYTILFVGFLFALAAAGFDLSRVTLLAGAFGVGIGFGLQNIVNNFVSGMILLFERPIQVGDTIEVGGLLGDVRRIGPRSSTLHTFDGAEVIIPNGMLIADQVVNWTLSDRRRRVTVGVGVKYGTDPERVLEILRELAAENETVLEDPAPLPIFVGFGESSLDFELRCWIPRYEEGFSIRTTLLTAINRKLAEAGIEIPFPQRDLHLRSVDEPARDALGDVARGGAAAATAQPWPRAAESPGERGPRGTG